MLRQDLTVCFPPRTTVPALLLEFAQWFTEHPRPDEWDFQIQGEKMGSDWLAVNGADLYDQFVPFIQLPRGSRVCIWRLSEAPLESCPVMYFHADGDDCVVGDSLVSFLRLFAAGKTGIEEMDIDKSAVATELRSQFSNWLQAKLDLSSLADLAELELQRTSLTGDLRKWLDQWNLQQENEIKENESLQLLLAKLKHYIAVNAQPWEKANFEIALVGDRFEISRKFFGDKEVPESKEIEVLLRRIRAERSARYPERGLWHTAWLSLSSDGGVSLDCDFLSDPEPLFKNEKPGPKDYKIDFELKQRSQYWQPEWLSSRLSTSSVPS